MSIKIEKIGRRSYLTGNTYPHKDALRAAGAHWDAERQAWWLGKADEAAALVGRLASGSESAPTDRGIERTGDGEATVVAGRATYKGKSYYVVGRIVHGRTPHWDDRVRTVETHDGSRLLIAFRDGSKTFWAAAAECRVEKTYDKPQTIGSLKRFAERAKSARAMGECPCSCHDDPHWDRPGHVGFDGCDRCGCEAA